MRHPLLPPSFLDRRYEIHFESNYHKCYLNGVELPKILTHGCRPKFSDGRIILKLGAEQASAEQRLWRKLSANQQYFVPIIHYHIANGVGWSIQPFLNLLRHHDHADVTSRHEHFVQQLFSDNGIYDYHGAQWGLTTDGLLAIFDYGFVHD